ncbi:primase-helicase zinc-binding domain-containing protein, partial [Stutzerimonas stutzeri]|uniref:primase-helicase zinc-binding domain-containing protein n=1 Tax=Stutzerimonas stutzeri TaxID=316 RepID=UPI0034D51EC7
MKTAELMRGRWHDALKYAGMTGRELSGKHCPCPMCGGKDRFRFDDKDGTGSYFCAGCGAGDGMKLMMRLTG